MPTRHALSITGINFLNNGASLGLKLLVSNHIGNYFKFNLQILNETVLYSLNVNCLSTHINVPDYYTEYGGRFYYLFLDLDCKILSKGEGYRS